MLLLRLLAIGRQDQVPYKYVKELKGFGEEVDIDSLSKARLDQKLYDEDKVFKEDLTVLDILKISKNLIISNYLYFYLLGFCDSISNSSLCDLHFSNSILCKCYYIANRQSTKFIVN